ncbi:response regulator [Bradyrhizobium sp. CCGB12]|uniref:response regulator n=1 Tax=Bradyrhizobium sp. CCGB12 TaxID=2949632 RepID=UPI0020B38F78|nr:response regulator [Bradyrhizobium sp. CCGB12]MCP3395385.1 response regulator [Bradyrhizobium sp. CCGB12]
MKPQGLASSVPLVLFAQFPKTGFQEVDGAVLDINLGGELVLPLLDRFIRQRRAGRASDRLRHHFHPTQVCECTRVHQACSSSRRISQNSLLLSLNDLSHRENDLRILVVEDEDLIRDVIVDILESHGHEVLQADTGEQALQLCSEAALDLIFTDVMLLGPLTGWDVAIRCRTSHPAIPVIYATGYTHAAPRPVSGSIMLHKPYRLEQLLESIRSLTNP